jgi:hypothetical protein
MDAEVFQSLGMHKPAVVELLMAKNTTSQADFSSSKPSILKEGIIMSISYDLFIQPIKTQ